MGELEILGWRAQFMPPHGERWHRYGPRFSNEELAIRFVDRQRKEPGWKWRIIKVLGKARAKFFYINLHLEDGVSIDTLSDICATTGQRKRNEY